MASRRLSWALLPCSLAIAACATSPARPPADPTPTSTTLATSSELTADPQSECDLVCERARIEARPVDLPDYTKQATDNANAVLASMHDDLLACYKKRVAVNPDAHGFITIDIVIGPDGKVRNVETTGGAVLGQSTMSCLVDRVKRASFDPPHGGGTLRIHVPFSLRRVSPADETL